MMGEVTSIVVAMTLAWQPRRDARLGHLTRGCELAHLPFSGGRHQSMMCVASLLKQQDPVGLSLGERAASHQTDHKLDMTRSSQPK